MRYLIIISMMLFTLTNVAACSNDKPEGVEPVVPGNGNILITYFSYPEPDGVDASTGASRLVKNEVVTGHVEFLAQVIREATEADTFRIRTVQQYPAFHQPLIEQANAEKESGARPALATHIENIDQYDIIFIGYPNWWGDLPMPLYTFLEEYDFKGKTIVPFNSHGGSGLSNTINTIRSIQPEATIVNGFSVSRNTVGDAKEAVISWLEEIGVISN